MIRLQKCGLDACLDGMFPFSTTIFGNAHEFIGMQKLLVMINVSDGSR
jgi:hypothetical protein